MKYEEIKYQKDLYSSRENRALAQVYKNCLYVYGKFAGYEEGGTRNKLWSFDLSKRQDLKIYLFNRKSCLETMSNYW